MPKKVDKLLILSIGNMPVSGDSIGVKVVERLKGIDFEEDIVILDAGMSIKDYFDEIANSKRIIAVCVVCMGNPAGTCYRWSESELRAISESMVETDIYELCNIISKSRAATGLPLEFILHAIEPANYLSGMTSTASIEAAISGLVKAVTIDAVLFSRL